LREVEERLWLPHQVADELLTCRLDVIHQKRKAYEDLRQSLDKFRAEIKKQMEELHRDRLVEAEDSLEEVRQACAKLATRLEEREDELPKLTSSPDEDEVWQVVDEIFADKVGGPYPLDKKKKVFEQGRKRYEKRIPPGYKDEEKNKKKEQGKERGNSNEERQFGDLIVWFQILDKAEETGKPIVFVTDDRKDDWWWRPHGKTLGPRSELVEEIYRRAGVRIYMYSTEQFLGEARRFLKQEVSDEVIDEVQELASSEDEAEDAIDWQKVGQALALVYGYDNLQSMEERSPLQEAQETQENFQSIGERSPLQEAQEYVENLQILLDIPTVRKFFGLD
jgi:hypothetical protein